MSSSTDNSGRERIEEENEIFTLVSQLNEPLNISVIQQYQPNYFKLCRVLLIIYYFCLACHFGLV